MSSGQGGVIHKWTSFGEIWLGGFLARPISVGMLVCTLKPCRFSRVVGGNPNLLPKDITYLSGFWELCDGGKAVRLLAIQPLDLHHPVW